MLGHLLHLWNLTVKDDDMVQKVATAHKMKSRQETTSLSQISADGKADNKRQALINTDTRRFKIQTGNMDTPPPPWQGLIFWASYWCDYL